MCLQSIAISPAEIGIDYFKDFQLTYQFFGQPLGHAPVVLVNHALTGNSSVAGVSGWWNQLIGDNLTINTKHYTILAFDIPGNGYDQNQNNFHLNDTYFSTQFIAELFWKGLSKLNIDKLYALIGGSLGGSIGWEMILQQPNKVTLFLPIACSLKASDWLIANVLIQDSILNHSSSPIEDARMHAMLLYRTPDSLQQKFENKFDEKTKSFQVEDWLMHHGKALKKRFHLESYKRMNHLLRTIGQHTTTKDIDWFLNHTQTKIQMVAVNSDYMFTEKEQAQTYKFIKQNYANINYSIIESIHGHDAFLIEYEQLNKILQPHFKI